LQPACSPLCWRRSPQVLSQRGRGASYATGARSFSTMSSRYRHRKGPAALCATGLRPFVSTCRRRVPAHVWWSAGQALSSKIWS